MTHATNGSGRHAAPQHEDVKVAEFWFDDHTAADRAQDGRVAPDPGQQQRALE